MTEHEKLKKICDTIGYNLFYTSTKNWFYFNSFIDNNIDEYLTDWDIFYSWKEFYKMVETEVYTELDVREIIFTTEFMDKYINFCIDNYASLNIIASSKEALKKWIFIWLMHNLDNPTEYLYKLIKW